MWLCDDKLKEKTAHFRLPSASQKRACLSSLMKSNVIFTLRGKGVLTGFLVVRNESFSLKFRITIMQILYIKHKTNERLVSREMAFQRKTIRHHSYTLSKRLMNVVVGRSFAIDQYFSNSPRCIACRVNKIQLLFV